jgi:hypothetical protein
MPGKLFYRSQKINKGCIQPLLGAENRLLMSPLALLVWDAAVGLSHLMGEICHHQSNPWFVPFAEVHTDVLPCAEMPHHPQLAHNATKKWDYLVVYYKYYVSFDNEINFCVRSQVFTAVIKKNVVFWDIKTQFVLHRRHITSPLHSPAS